MANSIRNILTLCGPQLEVDRFIGRFVRRGMEAFVPIPANYVPVGVGLPLGPENGWGTKNRWSDTWGACPEYDDFEILTDTSIIAGQFSDEGRPHITRVETNWVNHNRFTLADHFKAIVRLNLPGFLGQEEHPSALVVFYTKWKFPHRWIEEVINAEQKHGLIIHMLSYDVMASYIPPGEDSIGCCNYFHSYTANGTEHIQSGNCAIVVIEAEGPLPTFDEINCGDHDPDLPTIDDEGNEISEESIAAISTVSH